MQLSPNADDDARSPHRPKRGRGTLRALLAPFTIAVGAGVVIAARRFLNNSATASSLQRPGAPRDDCDSSDICLQQIARYRAADGTHSIHATLIAEFDPGVREATLHVAFCPPFEHLPAVEAEITDDSFANVKVAQLLHNGVQLDIRLPQPAEEKQHVAIEMVASEANECGC